MLRETADLKSAVPKTQQDDCTRCMCNSTKSQIMSASNPWAVDSSAVERLRTYSKMSVRRRLAQPHYNALTGLSEAIAAFSYTNTTGHPSVASVQYCTVTAVSAYHTKAATILGGLKIHGSLYTPIMHEGFTRRPLWPLRAGIRLVRT